MTAASVSHAHLSTEMVPSSAEVYISLIFYDPEDEKTFV